MNYEFELVGKSRNFQDLMVFVKKATKSDKNVLLLGETGVGKGVTAKFIHDLSKRKNQRFIKLNCSNLNENLLESELFGYRKGAFTGAFTDKPGLLEEANNGTFFLDEVGDLSLTLQAKLLSVIEDNVIRRIGSIKDQNIDVRHIFASNKNIKQEIKYKRFRIDLFFRLSIFTFYIEPLRKRREDIPLLVEVFLEKENRIQRKNIAFDQDAIDELLGYSFPGNIRELRTIIERAVAFADSRIIKKEDIVFFPEVNTGKKATKHKISSKELIDVLINHQGNKTKAAKELGISRRHIYRLLDDLH